MFWDKKDNKSSLPDLPPLKQELTSTSIPAKEEEEDNEDDLSVDKHPLPSFPDSPTKKGFSQSAIKDAIESPEPSEQVVKEMDEEDSLVPPAPTMTPKLIAREQSSNVFVKIDKFNSAKKALSSAQQKIAEIDRMLKKIRETRLREEQELTAWEKEVENAKARIEEASKNLFDKLS